MVTDPAALAAARKLLEADLEDLDLACSRFRPDSELVRINQGSADAKTTTVSPLLADAIAASLRGAELTDGDVDPTVGAALSALGYDRDFAEIAATESPERPKSSKVKVAIRAIPGWRQVRLDHETRQLTLPPGTQLDLGATAKAWAADRAAARLAATVGSGVLVSLGGDTAVAGEPPDGGWRIRIQDITGLPNETPSGPTQLIAITSGGLATSSTAARRWRHGGDVLHHILDPRTGLPAEPVWRTVSVTAGSCADANTASTAAIIRGREAPGWLEKIGLPARLVAQDGTVHTVAGWPAG
ncbi:MAG: FAD:protein FMN transferase [Streptosporangiaceae bacterium]